MKTWVFDLDGTLVDSFRHYYELLEDLVRRPITDEEKKSVVAQAPLDFLSQNFGVDRVEELMRQVHHQGLKDAETIVAYPGAAELLTSLQESGRQVAIFTNRDRESATLILKHSGLSKLVNYVVTGSCVTVKKPSAEGLHQIQKKFLGTPDQFVMIGDHDCDMQAAKSFGAIGIRASWHKYWLDSECALAQKQFFEFEDFTSWARQTSR